MPRTWLLIDVLHSQIVVLGKTANARKGKSNSPSSGPGPIRSCWRARSGHELIEIRREQANRVPKLVPNHPSRFVVFTAKSIILSTKKRCSTL